MTIISSHYRRAL